MLSRMFYFLRETGISLWRNVSMTIAAILTIFVTLSLVGVAMLVFFWNSAGTKNVEKSVQYEVFLVSKADETQIKTVKDQIETDKKKNLVVNYEFITKDQAWEFFKREFKDEKDTLKSVDKDVLPVSFIIAPKDPKLLDSLVAKYSAIPGVENVTKADFKDEIRRANLINQTLSVFALILLVASCVLVFNTVRLAVFARRREIEIMKLVGASNWFVQVPFMAEGSVQGLFGGIFASISAFIFKTVILDDTFSGKGFRGFFVTSSDLLLTILLVLFAGIAVGFVSSYLGLKRYLDV
ncbi:MAG: permease-like cell division protein FtsX [Acidimicrobiia bacterium]